MKKVKLTLAILVIIALAVFTLTACGNISGSNGSDTHTCQHRDEDDNSLCDKCGEGYTDGIDVTESSEGLEFELNEDGKTYTVTDLGGCTDTDIVIGLYNGAPVTRIDSYAFKDCSRLTSVTIGNSVMSIGEDAFHYCTSLTSVTIGNGVTSIGYSAFSHCSALTSVYISDIAAWCGISFADNLANPLFYAHNLYLNSELVTELVIPDGVTSFGGSAFRGCDSLASVTIPDSVTSIGEDAFHYCRNLTSITVNENNSVYKSIDGNVYSKDGKTLILYAIGKTEESFNIPDGVTSIGDYAFYGCTSLTSVTIPDSVTSIGGSAFEDCDRLTSVVIPDSVTSIGSKAFYDCFILTSVTIGNGVTSIGEYAFYYSNKLVEVINKSSLDITAGSSGYGYVGYFAKEVHSGESKIVNKDGYLFYSYDGINYLLGYTGNETELTLPEYYNGEGYEIFVNAFTDYDITSIIIPDSVTSIGGAAFFGCDSLTSVIIPDGVTSIDYGTFASCYSLTSVVIPDSVTSIDGRAFDGCTNLTSVVIPDGVTSIGGSAFRDCTSLTSIVIPDSVTSIGIFAFFGCDSITIYCEAGSKPSGWENGWDKSDYSYYCPVVWGYTGE